METGKCDLESLLESECVRKIHNTLTLKRDELARIIIIIIIQEKINVAFSPK